MTLKVPADLAGVVGPRVGQWVDLWVDHRTTRGLTTRRLAVRTVVSMLHVFAHPPTAPVPTAVNGEPEPPARAVDRAVDRPVFAIAPVLVVVAIKIAINMAVASRYGWHRDELYYADAGRHLSLGYVDFPPVTAWFAHLSSMLFGQSLAGLRSIAVLAGSGVVIVTALIARDLGGGRRAQVLAAVAITPLTLGSNAMFQTVSFDQLAWALVLWAAIWVLREGGTRRWLAFGLAVGVALMTKSTVVLLVLGLVLGFLATASGRSRLRGRGPWLATLLALVVAAPNVYWQVRHGWPSVEFFRSRSGESRADNPPTKFLLELIVGTGIAALPLWIFGVRRLLVDRRFRSLGVAVLTVIGGWLVLGGKSYYAAPALIVALAAGAVQLEDARNGCPTASHADSCHRRDNRPVVAAGPPGRLLRADGRPRSVACRATTTPKRSAGPSLSAR